MDVAVYIGGALLFFALIMASIALHEIGHLIPAKLFGVKTTQYFVGFGPTLWSRRRGETEYGVKAIPLGGFVRMVGMLPPGRGGLRTSNTGIVSSVVESARSAEWEDVRPEDEGRLFYQKPAWQRLIIMFGGPLMNIVLAFVLLLSVNLAYGQPRAELTVDRVSECVVPIERQGDTCRPTDPATPALTAGIRAGDTLVAFNGVPLETVEQAGALIRENGARTATVTVLRDGTRIDLPVTTTVTGVVDPDDTSRTVQAGFLGVQWEQRLVPVGPVETAQDMVAMSEQVFSLLARFPVRVYEVAADLVTGQPRDANSPMSVVGASRVAGEIASTDRITADQKVAGYVSTLGAVNLFVALFNFIPLLPLDGGHIAGALYEGARRGLARAFRRPDPGPFDVAKLMPIAYVVTTIIALSGVVLILADIIDPITVF